MFDSRDPESDLAFVDVEHPLTEATRIAGFRIDPAVRIQSLKPRKRPDQKSAIYRIGVRGSDPTSLVAKRSRISASAVERLIYREVLPLLPTSSPRYYGFVREDHGEYGWMFLEFVEGAPLSLTDRAHQPLAAQWLAELHTSARLVPLVSTLPDRGPSHYRQHLESSKPVISSLAQTPEAMAFRTTLLQLVDRLDMLLDHWSRLTLTCQGMPPTLVHGDFVPKNVRVVGDGPGASLYAFDWETAGFGTPVADLAAIATTDYMEAGRRLGQSISLGDLQRLALTGKTFRLLASIDWSIDRLRYGWSQKAAQQLERYSSELGVTWEALHRVEFPA